MRGRHWLILAILAGCAAMAAAWLVSAPQRVTAAEAQIVSETEGDPERGKLVFAAGDCASCHASPGQSDRLRLGGGIALASPYGTFRAPNISPDRIDGIGNWTAEDLANALLRGVSPDGSHYYPVFPYVSFTHMRPEEVRDLLAYLRTLPAVKGRPPDHEINPLFRIRRFVGFWKMLYFKPGPIVPDPAGDEKWNRGRYLVEALAHCAECHSSRDMLGGIRPSTRYAGGQDPVGTGFYPNITAARLGNWSEAQLAAMLKTGITPNHGRVGSSMADVVTNLAMLPDSDREAIAAFVKSLPSRPTPSP
ncbi:cytochrome c [Bradyrhizobium sp. WYCCWR 12699]|uniref:c-type cytochrome n=1 Tax=Bradyrhizobium sp. WYCCWR 12699 TaxID=3064203 RepID=UPI0028A35CCE|nr:cytochrome c [Bradyrhizobium sp. WYCCWR 12699]MDT4739911.1 cytochrome c [Bradyrhizobium sp. WYCCWR 12699]